MKRLFTFKNGRSRTNVVGVCLVVFAASLSAQVTSVKLPKADSSASFQVQDNASVVKLRQNGDGGFYLGGTFGTGVIPATGLGTRMMWYPAKAAFRAGYVSTQWDDANVGIYSTAMGYGTTASGNFSTAMGTVTVASGLYSTAMGYYDSASGYYSTAMGFNTKATDYYSTAMGFHTVASYTGCTAMGGYDTASNAWATAIGYYNRASGLISIAMGNNTKASGDYSTAMGYNTIANGQSSTAIGIWDSASGQNSTVMGNFVSTAGYTGSFMIGDYSTNNSNMTDATAQNQMTMRFAGGYRLFSNSAANVGVIMVPGGNSWLTISDSTKKTNFQKADGDYFLQSLSKLRLGSWNYKAQDAKAYQHYGPMAQEIFHYFGHDAKGTIGCDTLLASADMDGIMMICLQALEKRTGELQKANDKIAALQSSVDEMKAEMVSMKSELRSLAMAKTGNAQEKIALNTSSKGQ